jgi:hypothetical protein
VPATLQKSVPGALVTMPEFPQPVKFPGFPVCNIRGIAGAAAFSANGVLSADDI